MVEFILKFVIVLSALVVIQAFYNAYLYRQPKNVERISAVSSATIAVVLVSGALWLGVNYLNRLPYISNVVIAIDSPFNAFASYLPKPFLVIWFIIPILAIWIIFIFKSGLVYQKIKKDYFKFIAKNGSNEDLKEDSGQALNIATADEAKETKPEPIKINLKKEPPKRYFLENVPIKSFEHRTIKGIAKVIPLARENLIIGKTLQGYVAIYESNKGYKQLKRLFSENSIDIASLQSKPSIVLFTRNNVKCIGLKDYLRKIKAGERIYEF